MPDTKLVVLGSPTAGTPVVLAAPSAALDLPLKVLDSADPDDSVWVSYNAPAFLAARHHLSDDLRAGLDGAEAISNATGSAGE